VDMEEHVCQSCGTPVNEDDMVEGSEKGDFCHFCMVHDEFVADREQVQGKIADQIQEMTGKSREDALADAEYQMSTLKRWK